MMQLEHVMNAAFIFNCSVTVFCPNFAKNCHNTHLYTTVETSASNKWGTVLSSIAAQQQITLS